MVKNVGLNEYIPKDCPPVPLWGENLDETLAQDDEAFIDRVRKVFQNMHSLACSFYPVEKAENRFRIVDPTMDIDFARLKKVYTRLEEVSQKEPGALEKIISESIESIKEQISLYHQNKNFYLYSLAICRIFTIYLSNELYYDPLNMEIVNKIADFFFEIEGMDFWNREIALKFVSTLNSDALLASFKYNQQILTFALMADPELDDKEEFEKIRRLLLIMDFLYYASREVKHKKIPVKEFHIDVINTEWTKRMPNIYLAWYHARRGQNEEDEEDNEFDFEKLPEDLDKRTYPKVLYIDYPWAFDAANKSRLMNYEGQINRKKEVSNSFDLGQILLGGINIYLVVEVARDTLIEDSLNCLVNSGKNLQKPLKVRFKGEPGVDEGGVQKEFFQLLVKQIFDVEYGMFEFNEETHMYWIRKDTFELPLKFELVGIVLGLAIYNSHILDIHLPMAFYKKLLGKEVTLEDFETVNPQVAKSLKAILAYDKEDFTETM